jgi:hypothetical protein
LGDFGRGPKRDSIESEAAVFSSEWAHSHFSFCSSHEPARGQTLRSVAWSCVMATIKKPIQISFSDLCGVTPPPGNVSPVINSGFSPVRIKEIIDKAAGENTAYHTRFATLKFSDSNAGDVHSASVVPLGAGYKGTFSLGAVDQAANCVKWTFKVRDDKLDYLQSAPTASPSSKTISQRLLSNRAGFTMQPPG